MSEKSFDLAPVLNYFLNQYIAMGFKPGCSPNCFYGKRSDGQPSCPHSVGGDRGEGEALARERTE
jgi:hypothetical protein